MPSPTHSQYQSLGFYAIAWIEHFLVHGPGDVQGQSIELDDEFAAFILKAYEVAKDGSRKVRRAFLSRAKGRSKSGLAAMIECFEALGECRFDHWADPGEVSDWGYAYEPGEPVGRQLIYVEALNVATEESQAGNTYDAVYYMLHPDTCSDELLDRFGSVDVGLTRINLPDSRGFIEPVTASNESKDGGKSTFIVADETHLWMPPQAGVFKLGKMHQTMVRNLLKRKVASGWMLETSTMYAEGEGSVAEGTHAYAKKLDAAGNLDGKLLFDHCQASDGWDLEKRSDRLMALRESYGPAAEWMDLEAIADYWDDPQASHAEFRRFWLNQPVPLTPLGGPITEDMWAALKDSQSEPLDPVSFGVYVNKGQTAAAIAVAGYRSDSKIHVEIVPVATDTPDVKMLPGLKWIPGRVKELVTKWAPCAVMIDERSEAGAVIEDIQALGVTIETTNATGMANACSKFLSVVKEDGLRHRGAKDLQKSVCGGKKRDLADAWAWDRKDATSDITQLVAVTLALHGLIVHGRVQETEVWGFYS